MRMAELLALNKNGFDRRSCHFLSFRAFADQA